MPVLPVRATKSSIPSSDVFVAGDGAVFGDGVLVHLKAQLHLVGQSEILTESLADDHVVRLIFGISRPDGQFITFLTYVDHSAANWRECGWRYKGAVKSHGKDE